MHWLAPLDRQSFRLITKYSNRILTQSQSKNAAIWAKIFPNNHVVYDGVYKHGSKHNVDLALVGRIHDIGNKDVEKPYLFLFTTPPGFHPWWKEAHMQRFIRGKKVPSDEPGPRTVPGVREFPEFILNYQGLYNIGKPSSMSRKYASQFADNQTSILYYSKDRPSTCSISICPHPHGYGELLYIRSQDGDSLPIIIPRQIAL